MASVHVILMVEEVFHVFNDIDIQHTGNCDFTDYLHSVEKQQKENRPRITFTAAISSWHGCFFWWSNPVNNTGCHYTIFVASIFFIPSLIIGYKNPEDFGALIGKRISSIYLFIIIISLLFFVISCLSKWKLDVWSFQNKRPFYNWTDLC